MSGFYGTVTNNEIFDLNLTKKSQNFRMDQEELASDRITVIIRLTSAQHIEAIKDMLEQILPDFDCQERGTIITVSGCPPDRDVDTNTVLAIAQSYDAGAVEET